MIGDYEKEIIGLLEKNTSSGQSPSQVFYDWLEMTEAALRMLPQHAASVAETGELADDDAAARALWERLRRTYRDRVYFEHFQQAFGCLLAASEISQEKVGYRDIVGDIYMEFGNPNPGSGQFFTPGYLAKAMAEMTIDRTRMIDVALARVREAIAVDPLAEAFIHADALLKCATEGNIQSWLIDTVLPFCGQHIRPITVCDPAVGSGVMLLAAASCFPQWMVRTGLVQFYGQDMDHACVLMANVNIKLYGLNGWGLKYRAAGLQMLSCLSVKDESSKVLTAVQMAKMLPEPDFALPNVGHQFSLFSPSDHES